jgi:hypothetical protein
MYRSMITGQRLVAVFLIGFVLLNYPILSLFDRSAAVFGVPLLFLYIFAAWAGIIAVMAWIIEGVGKSR